MSKALVVLSGGQDSVTCLGVAIKENDEVAAISFNYGQRHDVELAAAEAICSDLDIPWIDVDFGFIKGLVTSALLNPSMDIKEKHAYKKDLPASFVPNRNTFFLTAAHAYAQEIGANKIYTGVCQTDYSGYPDCRDWFIRLLEKTLNVGYETDISIITPLMFLTKAQTFKLAKDVGFLNIVLHRSVTCYNGDLSHMNDWGFGCGECPACKLRSRGWKEFLAMK